MMLKHISIEQLAQPCLTRYRGREAFLGLEKYLEAGPVEIDFSKCETVSLSFLDELVTNIIQSNNLERVAFHMLDQMVEGKLSRVAGIRNVTLYCRQRGRAVHRVVPKLPSSKKATFVASKALL